MVYLLKVTDRGLVGVFKSMESAINFCKENYDLSDNYEKEEWGLHTYIYDNECHEKDYMFTIFPMILHD